MRQHVLRRRVEAAPADLRDDEGLDALEVEGLGTLEDAPERLAIPLDRGLAVQSCRQA